MSWLRWQQGRQGTGYEKMLLAQSKWLKFDCWLLRYTVGDFVAVHIDPASDGYEHHRVNIILKRADNGGLFYTFPPYSQDQREMRYHQERRIIRFRPDIQGHGVTIIRRGTRYVLSIGWLRKAQQ